MALIAIASDKGAPGVTTTALALASVWPRPVLLAECDPGGGDVAYRFPGAAGSNLDPRLGVLSLAVAARRGIAPNQVWEHVQKLYGGLDVLAGVTNAEQGAGLNLLWGQIGRVLTNVPQADVIADCGRLGADGPVYDLLAEAATVLMVSRTELADVIRLRDRAAAFAAAMDSRGRRGFGATVLFVADRKKHSSVHADVDHVLKQSNIPAVILGAIADDPKGAALFNGGMSGKLGNTPLIKSARAIVQQLVGSLPPQAQPQAQPAGQAQNYAPPGRHHTQATPQQPQAPAQPAAAQPAAAQDTGSQPAASNLGTGPQQTQLRPVASGTRSGEQPGASTQPTTTQETADNWAGLERQKWREHERQQSGGT